MSRESIQKCVSLAGSQQALVDRMKPYLPERLARSLRQGHISNWINQNRVSPVPPSEYVMAMVKAVEGRVPASEHRPDLYGEAEENAA